MRTLAFDPVMGASGDMLLGALLALGANRRKLDLVEEALPVEYRTELVNRSGIQATSVQVFVSDSEEETDNGEGIDPPQQEHQSHSHDHQNNSHDHTHHGNDHSEGDPRIHEHVAEGHGSLRTLPDVLDIVESMDLSESVFEDVHDTFHLLASAEAAVHGTDIETAHFHEVGADDAIADIVGTAVLIDDLNVDRIVTTPVSTGEGTIEMRHGHYPIPSPAVLEIAERADFAISGGPVSGELLTPTGAALLAHFADGVDRSPALRVEKSGYGAGSRGYDDRPNVLRATLGEEPHDDSNSRAESTNSDALWTEDVAVVETTLDDTTPEILGSLHETLADAGALDVAILPATLKKSRPGHVIQVVAKPDDAPTIARRLGEETGTLGVRLSPVTHRWIAERTVEDVTIQIDGESYSIQVKIATDRSGNRFDVSAEYDDALSVAQETSLSVREVIRRAETAAEEYV